MPARIQITRRNLLRGAAASLSLPALARAANKIPVRAVSEAAWKSLAAKITGGVVRPDDPRFGALTQPENLRYYNPPLTRDARPDLDAPLGVVLPRDASEVAAAISWARDVGMPMVPRSGGHSYAGCSTVAGLVIHTGRMRQVGVLGGDRIELAGGALNRDVYAGLKAATSTDAPNGLTITHGRCATVGVSAFLMGGGIGFGMRDHGLGCDLVESVELVLADGRIVTASANEDPDLLWAVRGGGGGNIGVATRWRLRAVPAEPVVMFDLSWTSASKEEEEEIFARLVRLLERAPDRMGAKLKVTARESGSDVPITIDLMGQLRGSLEEFRSIFGAGLSGATSECVALVPYWDAQTSLAEDGKPNRYQEISVYAGRLSSDLISNALGRLRNWPGTRSHVSLTAFLAGGRISASAPDATAFVHRSAQWLIACDLGWTEHDDSRTIEQNLHWQRGLHDALTAQLGDSGSYQNFPDPGLADPATAYWGANLARLRKVKRAIDPDNVFDPPRRQGILP